MRALSGLCIRAIIAAGLAANPAGAQDSVRSNAQGELAVTIYNGGQSLVQDIRQIAFPAGRTRQEFPDVSAQIRPQTVAFAAADTAIVEQNFDYDLLSPNALMQKAVGETVTLLRTNPATGAETRERAKVLAVNGGVVLQIGSRIEILRDDGMPVRVIFDKIPPNLRAKPTLSITLDSARAGTRPATLSYLTNGLGWAADYVSLYDEKAGTIDVQGWVTLTNNTGTTFDNAKTLLVAGTPSAGGAVSPRYRPRSLPPGNLRRAGTETAPREQLGDYYLYPLAERTTIANAQTKQVSFLDVSGVPAQKIYEFTVGGFDTMTEPASAASVIKFSTSAKGGGLGDALPAGTVRFYQRDLRGDPQFIGENNIGHTPMGSELGLATGLAFDVKVQATVVERERVSANITRSSMSYTLTNARAQPVTLDLIQRGLDWYWDETRILAESRKSERLDSDGTRWRVELPANGEATITATFETRY
ncbi:DUF4139 domain-containing protein [Sphingopyxis alaskensis]|jgi:hypothetical protein|uniref:Uncharacterized protein n=1 Tax=Sphingopyxis alaskensis (strain DSM 13593 / LMG 18877 / RB2256) TaxID=317655 RepID=Q1GPK6_SPHAL|nr:DUF4139 domain-containing protein [Sphingopyxis alaskensis]ABF54416.1 conserved hypothetical protein [Sphingopyxis alaskensis RB2256]MCM3417872.1 DUF4139 domain-containing protein [Sphingopyxis alaskensis]